MTGMELYRPNNRGVAPNLEPALIEATTQPLYSAVALNGAAVLPATLRFFQFSIGETVPGAGSGAIASTLLHTNMELGGVLATPKIFEMQGIRFIMSNLTDGAGTMTAAESFDAGAAAPDQDVHEDALLLFWGTVLRLHVGTKDYFKGPTFLCPANCGVSGYTAKAAFDTADLETSSLQAVQGGGQPHNMDPYSVFLPPNQLFYGELSAPQATTPTISLDRTLWMMIDGRLGREVM